LLQLLLSNVDIHVDFRRHPICCRRDAFHHILRCKKGGDELDRRRRCLRP
jgi:hypothetical protein